MEELPLAQSTVSQHLKEAVVVKLYQQITMRRLQNIEEIGFLNRYLTWLIRIVFPKNKTAFA